MLDTNPKAKSLSSPLNQWIHKTIGGEGLRLKVRLNSHKLHIICEAKHLPESSSIADQLKKAIPSALPLLQQESVQCINVYGLLLGQDHPRWSETLLINFPARATLGLDEINQLDILDVLEQLNRPTLDFPEGRLHQRSPEHSLKSTPKSTPKSTSELTPKALTNLTLDHDPTPRANHISRTLTPHQTSNQIPSLTAIAEALHPFVKPFGVTIKVEEVIPKSSSDFSPSVLSKLANKLSDLPTTSLGNQQAPSSEANQASHLHNQANLQGTDNHPKLRVNCYCEYSLAPERIVPLLIQQLRRLNLSSYRDVLLSGYLEEKNKPLWAVKGNLTADQQLLREWAKWGDRAALVELLNTTLAQAGIRFRSIPKEGTLHLFCRALGSTPPDQSLVMGAIVPLLEELAPHNLQAFAIYGTIQQTNLPLDSLPDSLPDLSQTSPPDAPSETPVWIQWINISSAQSVHNVRELAQQGDGAALEFLLKQAVNPDIQTYLATGGIEVMIRQREDLLDVVTETPLGPSQKSVVKSIVRCVSSLELPNIAGVRIYGRPSGKSRPDWKYGKDFRNRSRSSLAPKKSTPLTTTPAPTTTPASLGNDKKQDKPSIPPLLQPLRDILGRSGLLIEADEPDLRELEPKAVAVWAVLGLILMLQTDWLLGAVSKRVFPPIANNSTGQTRIQADPANPNSLSSFPPGQGSIDPENTNAFNNSGFTGDGGNVVVIDQDNNQVKSARIAQATALLAATDKQNPSFNSSLLNEKLLLYQERIKAKGHPPDVLIVGSSRALRGIDPLALQQSLAAQGYGEVDIFNFGINGATAKFVDFLLRRMLAPEQLPKLVIWADGARAFNGNREDLTYNALTHTDGYRQVVAGDFPGSVELSGETTSRSQSFLKTMRKFTYPEGNDRLQQLLSQLSQSYAYRQELLQLTQRTLGKILPTNHNSPVAQLRLLEPQLNESAIDIDGFLALEERFEPEVYYQKYAKVPGDYDQDYEAFNLEGKQDAALGELTQYLQSRQVKLVFVNLPLTDLYLDPVRMKYEGQFENYLRNRATQYQFIVRNLNTPWLNQYPYFSDPSHLNRYGAEALSRMLAEDPVMPWQGN